MSQNTNNNEVHLHQGRFGLSLLNSMIGEYLEKENNPLAVQMGFYHQSKKLDLDLPLATQLETPLSNKVVVFVHGLANLENVWDYPPDDGTTASILSHYIDVYLDAEAAYVDRNYGTQLREEYGFTPFFLRYNTGLSVEKNGRHFSKLLSTLFESYPIDIDDLVLVGYGMGGRLLSHTQYAAQKSDSPWLDALSKCLYLGNLNEGSLLALILQLGSNLMRQLPMYYSQTLADWFDYRSKQIQEQNNIAIHRHSRKTNDAPSSVYLENKRHFFIGGDLKPDNPDTSMPQSFLVPPQAPTHSQNAYLEGISPVRLTHSDRVYTLMSDWIAGDRSNAVKLLTHSPQLAFPIQQVMFEDIASNDAVNRIFIAGTVDLMASAYDKTVETLETMHYSIVEEPFYALDKVPVVSQMAKPVEAAQREVLDTLYRTLRNRGKKMHKFASDIV